MAKCRHKWIAIDSMPPRGRNRFFLCPECSAGPVLYRCVHCTNRKMEGPFHTTRDESSGDLVRERHITYLQLYSPPHMPSFYEVYYERTERVVKKRTTRSLAVPG